MKINIFLNANTGFDKEEFRDYCSDVEIIGNRFFLPGCSHHH